MGVRMRARDWIFGLALACTAFSAQGAPVAADVPFTLIDNRVFVPAMLNGTGPFQLLLDTGADTGGISLKTMRAIGARAEGHDRIGGAGEGTDAVVKTHVASLRITSQTRRAVSRRSACTACPPVISSGGAINSTRTGRTG